MDMHMCLVVPVYVKPQSMNDERACIGIVARCPELGYLACRIADDDERIIGRIVNFFPKFGREQVVRAMKWARHDIELAFSRERQEGGSRAFENLIRPRENVVRYGSPQALISEKPAEEFDRVYAEIVGVGRTSSPGPA